MYFWIFLDQVSSSTYDKYVSLILNWKTVCVAIIATILIIFGVRKFKKHINFVIRLSMILVGLWLIIPYLSILFVLVIGNKGMSGTQFTHLLTLSSTSFSIISAIGAPAIMTKIANDRNRAEDNRLRSLPYFVINPSKGNVVNVEFGIEISSLPLLEVDAFIRQKNAYAWKKQAFGSRWARVPFDVTKEDGEYDLAVRAKTKHGDTVYFIYGGYTHVNGIQAVMQYGRPVVYPFKNKDTEEKDDEQFKKMSEIISELPA